MKRGVLAITDEEFGLLSATAKNSGSLKESPLLIKFSANHLGDDLQLSEEEAEILLDLLPVPGENPSQQELNLREKLSKFLRKLRS